MTKRSFLHAVWLIPTLLFVLLIQQISVLNGIQKTYNEGDTYSAFITDFRIKQIAAQTNGYVDLMFERNDGQRMEERLSLHAQHASRIIGLNEVEIRYREGATYDIVMVTTYEYHKNTVWVNIGVIALSLIILIPVAVFASRYAMGKTLNQRDDSFALEFTEPIKGNT